jgi:mannan endo-1,4-beta-mannosidase
MTNLIGTSLLGNKFIQDTNANFIKIDNVAVGDSQKYGYDTKKGVIGEMINIALGDPKIVVVIYDWSSNTGYFKSGFDIDDNADSKSVPGFTSYIVKSRISRTTSVSVSTPIQSNIATILDQRIFNTPFQYHSDTYVKIVGVTLGGSDYFKVDTKKDSIDAILATGVNTVVYNTDNGIGYIKSGFNLSDPTDSCISPIYTTYVKLVSVSQQNLDYFKYGPKSITPPVATNGFLKSNGGKLVLNGNKFVAVGYNAFFMGLLQETTTYPTHNQVEEVFRAAHATKATAIRSHTLGFSAQSDMALISGNGLNEDAWEIIDYAFLQAKRYGIKLILPLTDSYDYYNGSYEVFCAPDGTPKDQFFTAIGPRNQFKKYIKEYLTHVNKYTGLAIRDSVEVGILELGNELGNIRPDAGSTAIPTQEWLGDITSYIRSIDTNHLIMSGSDECLGSLQSDDFAIDGLDVYSAHFYWQDWDRLKSGAQRASNVDKPYIIGEYDSGWNNAWYHVIEGMESVSGSIAWSIYPHEDGTQSGNRVPHGDGFTIWYDNKDPTNTSKLTFLTNHFRRMQGLPEVKSPF